MKHEATYRFGLPGGLGPAEAEGHPGGLFNEGLDAAILLDSQCESHGTARSSSSRTTCGLTFASGRSSRRSR